jgi:hypothetical protein
MVTELLLLVVATELLLLVVATELLLLLLLLLLRCGGENKTAISPSAFIVSR